MVAEPENAFDQVRFAPPRETETLENEWRDSGL